MKSRTAILMVVAVGCGLVASYLTSRMLAQQQQAQEKVKILVAKGPIALGTLVKDPKALFTEKEFIKGQEPRNAINNFDAIKDKRVNKRIGTDVHVTEEDLIKGTEQGGLPVVIPAGYRAMSIKVAPDTNVAGFVLPNTRVDIVSTTRGAESIARILLQDVLVLAVDMHHTRAEDGKAALAAQTVTLQVKPEEAEKLTMAGAMGELRLVLRGLGDPEKVATKGVRPIDVVRNKDQSGGEENEEGTGGANSGPAVAPTIPDVPVPEKTVEPAKPAEPLVQVKPRKKHVMTVINGQGMARHVFDENEDGETIIVEKKQLSEPLTPAKPATSETPVPAPTPATPEAGTGPAKTPEKEATK